MNAAMVQITMTAADSGNPGKGRYVTVALPCEALVSAMAAAAVTAKPRTLPAKRTASTQSARAE
jgi:hypothetical protein